MSTPHRCHDCQHTATHGSIESALRAAADVFEEMDSVSWPQSERDAFYGDGGKCPVDYDAAQSAVLAALQNFTPNTKDQQTREARE
jgi:hypothetical protein